MATTFKKVANNAGSTLLAGILATDVTLSVQAGQGALFPATAGGATYWATLSKPDGSAYEVVLVTGLTTDTFTVTRAQQGTSAAAWAAGDKFDRFWTRQDVDDITAAINTLEAAGGGSAAFSLTTSSVGIYEEFLAGGGSSGTYGTYGWTRTGGTFGGLAAVANHPGIMQLGTSTTAGTLAYIYLSPNGTASVGAVDGAALWDVTWIIRPDVLDAETMMRIGLVDQASNNPPGGAFVERLPGDTNDLFPVCRVGASQTRGTSVSAISAGTWYRIRIRRIDASTIGFTVGAGSEQTITTNLPTAALIPCVQIQYAAAGTLGAKTITLDAFGLAPMTVTR